MPGQWRNLNKHIRKGRIYPTRKFKKMDKKIDARKVFGKALTEYGAINTHLVVLVTDVSAPPDECTNAVEVFEDMPHADTTFVATGSSSSSCADGGDTLDVWHKFIPDTNGLYSMSLCPSGFDTTLSLFDSCAGTEIACNDDFCDLQSQLSTSLTQANTYYIRVAGYDGETGSYKLTITEEICETKDEPNNPDPTHLAVDVVTNTTLSWNDGIESLSYSSSYAMPKVIYGDDDRMDEYKVNERIKVSSH